MTIDIHHETGKSTLVVTQGKTAIGIPFIGDDRIERAIEYYRKILSIKMKLGEKSALDFANVLKKQIK